MEKLNKEQAKKTRKLHSKNSFSPIFLLGHPRSGTNYLKNLLAIHPNIHALTEPYSLHSSYFIEQDGRVWTEKDYNQSCFFEGLKSHPSLLALLKELQEFLVPSHTEINLIKETTFLLKLQWLRPHLEYIKIIFLIRSPYKVIDSFKKDNLYKKWGYDSRFNKMASQINSSLKYYKGLFNEVNQQSEVSKLMFLWIVKNFEAIKNIDQFKNIIVKYEKLITYTQSELMRIMDFTDLGFDHKQSSFIKESQEETRGINIYSSFRNKDRQLTEAAQYLTKDEVDEIERLLSYSERIAEEVGIDFTEVFYRKPKCITGQKDYLSIQNIDEQKEYSSEGCLLFIEEILDNLIKNSIKFEENYFSKFSITNAQFCSFLNASGIKNNQDQSYKYVNTFGERCRIRYVDGLYKAEKGFANNPCTYVNWYGCKAFCDWAGVQLPSKEIITKVVNAISFKNLDLTQINIGERIGKILSTEDLDYQEELLYFIGNIWKWTDAIDDEVTANEYGGAFNSSKYDWSVVDSKRHKRFGASSLGFHVLIPRDKIDKNIEKRRVEPHTEITQINELESILSQLEFSTVKNIFFDLDGTLHDFKIVARMAMSSVYDKIDNTYGIEVGDLQKVYGEIMEQVEKQAFSDGKKSYEYRKERFAKLLKHFSIENEGFVTELVELYGDIFESNLSIEGVTLDTLQSLSCDYKIFLITEGPLDAQLRTIKILDIEKFFQGIFTSGESGKIKETGELFDLARNKLNLQKNEVVIIGDSLARDIKGANIAGIQSILVKFFND
jgi:putative hydrolase of the HAD superfamily